MSVYEGLDPIDLTDIRTYELAERPSKVSADDFARPVAEGDSLSEREMSNTSPLAIFDEWFLHS